MVCFVAAFGGAWSNFWYRFFSFYSLEPQNVFLLFLTYIYYIVCTIPYFLFLIIETVIIILLYLLCKILSLAFILFDFLCSFLIMFIFKTDKTIMPANTLLGFIFIALNAILFVPSFLIGLPSFIFLMADGQSIELTSTFISAAENSYRAIKEI